MSDKMVRESEAWLVVFTFAAVAFLLGVVVGWSFGFLEGSVAALQAAASEVRDE